MPASTQNLTVEPIVGEPARFFVTSRSSEHPHLVDIEENDGKGWCDCQHHSFRLQPKIDRGEPSEPCVHVSAVLEFVERN